MAKGFFDVTHTRADQLQTMRLMDTMTQNISANVKRNNKIHIFAFIVFLLLLIL